MQVAAMVASREDKNTAVGVFEPPMSKFVFACLARMVCSEDTMVYTGFGGTSLRLVCCCLCYWHLVCSRGYKQVREGKDPKSSERNERVLRAQSLLSHVLVSCSCVFISWFGLVQI